MPAHPELHVQEAQVILHGRTQESGTPTQASCCRVEPQARSWGGQDPGVKVLRHSGPQVQSLQTVVDPQQAPPGPERSFLSLADCHGGTSWSGHHAGKCGRKEKGRKIEGWERRGGAHRAGNAGPNLAVSYFRTAPWGPRTRDTGGGQSGCVNALCPSSRSRQPLLGCLGREEGGNAACQHCAG